MYDSFIIHRDPDPWMDNNWNVFTRAQPSHFICRWVFDDKIKVIDGKAVAGRCFTFNAIGSSETLFKVHVYKKPMNYGHEV